MKIYLAAAFARASEMRLARRALEERGHQVVSRWLEQAQELQLDDPQTATLALSDLDDVRRSDTVLFFSNGKVDLGRGGRLVELGAAIALRKKTVVVGPPENLFCMLPQVYRVADLEGALGLLTGATAARTS